MVGGACCICVCCVRRDRRKAAVPSNADLDRPIFAGQVGFSGGAGGSGHGPVGFSGGAGGSRHCRPGEGEVVEVAVIAAHAEPGIVGFPAERNRLPGQNFVGIVDDERIDLVIGEEVRAQRVAQPGDVTGVVDMAVDVNFAVTGQIFTRFLYNKHNAHHIHKLQ